MRADDHRRSGHGVVGARDDIPRAVDRGIETGCRESFRYPVRASPFAARRRGDLRHLDLRADDLVVQLRQQAALARQFTIGVRGDLLDARRDPMILSIPGAFARGGRAMVTFRA